MSCIHAKSSPRPKAGVLLLLLFLAAGQCRAADWPQWRGPNRDGISPETVNTAWGTNGPPVLWRALVSTGFSSIAVSGGRVYTMGNSNGLDLVWCLDAASGRPLWRHHYASRLDPQYYEGGPGATPTVHAGKVFTLSKWGTVLCLDAQSGAVNWRHDLWHEGIRSNRWGFAGSPLVYKSHLILNAGTAGTALHLDTGKVVWTTGTNVAGYASPVLCSIGGHDAILIFGSDFLAAIEPATGRQLWRRAFKTSYDSNNTDPLVWGDQALISSFSRGTELLSWREPGPPALVYATKDLKIHLSPGLRNDQFLYAFHGEAKTRTDLRCIHLPTGQVMWRATEPAFGTLIAARNAALILSEKGELLAGELHPEGFKPIAKARILEGVCWTPPALAAGVLYARNAIGHLVAVDLGAPHSNTGGTKR